MSLSPNHPAAPNPAITSRVRFRRRWREDGEPGREAAFAHHAEITMRVFLKALVLVALAGCCTVLRCFRWNRIHRVAERRIEGSRGLQSTGKRVKTIRVASRRLKKPDRKSTRLNSSHIPLS